MRDAVLQGKGALLVGSKRFAAWASVAHLVHSPAHHRDVGGAWGLAFRPRSPAPAAVLVGVNRSVAREIGPYLRGAFGGLAGRRTHASQHLLFGPTDHRGLRVGSEAGALDFARRKRKA